MAERTFDEALRHAKLDLSYWSDRVQSLNASLMYAERQFIKTSEHLSELEKADQFIDGPR